MSGILVKTGVPVFDEFYPRIRSFLLQDRLSIAIDARVYNGYRSPDSKAIWIRDHSDILRGARYFDEDLRSATVHFAETQATTGRIFDYFMLGPDPGADRENWLKYVRVPVEADVEYRFVKAVYLAWQATGQDEWMRQLIPAMELALHYATSNPWRWEKALQLVKRAFTIDTWDFDYTGGPDASGLNFQITPETHWGIMHGDNSGYYEAMGILSRLHRFLGNTGKAAHWRRRADALQQQTNKICWNGRFYTHFVHLTEVEIPGVDQTQQLSLSNPMDINRGLASHEQAVLILREYQKRGAASKAFAEWFSLDPPFPDGLFGDPKLVRGAYINGGIMPLVGGELARAALEHGLETYGVQQLRKYGEMIRNTDETYLWYFPDGTPSSRETSTSPDAMPTDGWGSSAMLYAFVEGLCGVVDLGKLFETTKLSPRWLAAGVQKAEVSVEYANGAGVAYTFAYDEKAHRLRLTVSAPGTVKLNLLLPPKQTVKEIRRDRAACEYALEHVEQSTYCRLEFTKKAKITVALHPE